MAKKIQNSAVAQISLWHQQHQSLKSVLVVVVSSLSRVWILWPHGLQPARFLCPQDFPGKVAISFSKGSSPSSDWTRASYIAGRFFTTEPPGKPQKYILPIKTIFKWSFFQVNLLHSLITKCLFSFDLQCRQKLLCLKPLVNSCKI